MSRLAHGERWVEEAGEECWPVFLDAFVKNQELGDEVGGRVFRLFSEEHVINILIVVVVT